MSDIISSSISIVDYKNFRIIESHHWLRVSSTSCPSSLHFRTRKSFPQRLRELTVYDIVWHGYSVISKAIESEIDFCDALLHSGDEGLQIAHSVRAGFAAFNSGERKGRIIQEPSNVRWFFRSRA